MRIRGFHGPDGSVRVSWTRWVGEDFRSSESMESLRSREPARPHRSMESTSANRSTGSTNSLRPSESARSHRPAAPTSSLRIERFAGPIRWIGATSSARGIHETSSTRWAHATIIDPMGLLVAPIDFSPVCKLVKCICRTLHLPAFVSAGLCICRLEMPRLCTCRPACL